jgi:hypothetical protein
MSLAILASAESVKWLILYVDWTAVLPVIKTCGRIRDNASFTISTLEKVRIKARYRSVDGGNRTS